MATIESTTEIRPFSVELPEEDLVDLRQRIAATRWPERETVADDTQSVQLATMEELVRLGQALTRAPLVWASVRECHSTAVSVGLVTPVALAPPVGVGSPRSPNRKQVTRRPIYQPRRW